MKCIKYFLDNHPHFKQILITVVQHFTFEISEWIFIQYWLLTCCYENCVLVCHENHLSL